MDENLENAAQEFEKDLNNAAEDTWKPVEETSDQAQAHIAEAAETVEGGWSEVKDEFQQASAETWSKPETPQTPPAPQPEADRWGAPETKAADDPNRWTGELYTPEAEPPAPAEAPKAQEAPKVVDYTATPPAQPEKKDKFPVWAIVLIVLLVLCLCVLLPILILGGSLVAILENASIFVPSLFI
ncbi:MAG: hypothetical protein KBA05_05495 [Anaerolineaceae bacterium]|jgi:hypothetical protein|nr:hypothetical protein [Anaerolineaceae bacterium]MDI9531346.1 hypothetical protein [Chloroflexota bacterium]HOF29154.1 hypothetical protein [Anaerolineaceae bacterium]